MFFEDAFIIATIKYFFADCFLLWKSFHSGSRTWHYYVFLRMSIPPLLVHLNCVHISSADYQQHWNRREQNLRPGLKRQLKLLLQSRRLDLYHCGDCCRHTHCATVTSRYIALATGESFLWVGMCGFCAYRVF